MDPWASRPPYRPFRDLPIVDEDLGYVEEWGRRFNKACAMVACVILAVLVPVCVVGRFGSWMGWW